MVTKKPKPIVIGGFCKSGTTAVAKCLAHCLGIGWQNEIREVWHLDKYAANENPQKEIQVRIKQNKEDKIINFIVIGGSGFHGDKDTEHKPGILLGSKGITDIEYEMYKKKI